MLTKDLISRIAEETGLSKKRTEQLLNTSNAIMRETLMDGNSIQLLGLGTLEVRERKGRTIVHPRTGERTEIPAKSQLAFKPVANLKSELNNK
ncbi:MAG: HU family DNA-binding protein [Paludibacteraceae bacterium]|nr:HU family DNA-binding protein [Paludibacteraceae bacterium]MBR4263681.1 HU family DNA-binding protein [Paludibacteraceae bacterium]